MVVPSSSGSSSQAVSFHVLIDHKDENITIILNVGNFYQSIRRNITENVYLVHLTWENLT
jgi:hypothetical protein